MERSAPGSSQPFPSPLPACSVFRVSPVLIPMLLLIYIPGKKKWILWICLISATKRLLEVSLCWDAYKKVWAWSSKLICCQIELNNFLLLSGLAASSLGGGTLVSKLHCELSEAGSVWSVWGAVPLWSPGVSWARLHPRLSLSCAFSWDCPDLGSTAEIFSPRCSFLSNPWTI